MDDEGFRWWEYREEEPGFFKRDRPAWVVIVYRLVRYRVAGIRGLVKR